MQIDSTGPVLLRLAAVEAGDFALIGVLVARAIRSGGFPDAWGVRRADRPLLFWGTVAAAVAAGIGFAALIAYVVLAP